MLSAVLLTISILVSGFLLFKALEVYVNWEVPRKITINLFDFVKYLVPTFCFIGVVKFWEDLDNGPQLEPYVLRAFRLIGVFFTATMIAYGIAMFILFSKLLTIAKLGS